MVDLVDNKLHAENMLNLLQSVGINLESIELDCKGKLITFMTQHEEQIKNLAAELQALLETDDVKPAIQSTRFKDLVLGDWATAICTDPQNEKIHRQSCETIFSLLLAQDDCILDESNEYLTISIPEVYEGLLNCFDYQYTSISQGKIKFNIKKYLEDHPAIILVNGQSSYLFTHSDLFAGKKIFYVQEQVNDSTIKVTPYFFIPAASESPIYHFVLDTSSSMETNETLTALKEGAIRFAESLFQFQANAEVIVYSFDSDYRQLGSYKKDTFSQLRDEINKLYPYGSTCLFKTTQELLRSLNQSQYHNNVLLFTDGENTVGLNGHWEIELNALLSSIKEGSPLITARNKFFILSYNVQQPQVLHDITQAFGSEVIQTSSIDFQTALSTEGKLCEWAVLRELFTFNLEITGNLSSETARTISYVRSYNMSGQIVALDPIYCRPEESLYLTIEDGHCQRLVDDRKSFSIQPKITPLPLGSAEAAAVFGIYALDSDNKGTNLDLERGLESKFS